MNRRALAVTLCVAALGASSCSTMRQTAPWAPQAGDRYRIVDCELAPRLIPVPGGGVIPMTNRLLRTSAIDCYEQGGVGHFDDSPRVLALWLQLACAPGDPKEPTSCHGSPEAQYRVADLIEHGPDADAKLAEAFAWYLRAAEQGHRAAAAKVARAYEHARGVVADPVQASRWYAVASATTGPTDASLSVEDVLRQQERIRQIPKPGDDTRRRDRPDEPVRIVSADERFAGPFLRRRSKDDDREPERAKPSRLCPPFLTAEQLAALSKEELANHAALLQACSGVGPHDGPASHGAAVQADERSYAILIANESYRHWPHLDTPWRDATALKHVLEKKFGFQVFTTVRDGHDGDSILKPIEDLRRAIAEQKAADPRTRINVLLFYSGYARVRSLGEHQQPIGYWIPVEAPSAELSKDWLPNRSVADQFSVMKDAFRVLVIADATFSGVLDRTILGQRCERDASKGPSRKLLAAGTERPTVGVQGAEHSRFTDAIIEVLEGVDGEITGSELFNRVRRILAARADDDSQPQYREMDAAGHQAGDFLFHASADTRPEVRTR